MPRFFPKFLTVSFFLALTLFAQSEAQAVFDFSVAPRRGGQDLRIHFDETLQQPQQPGGEGILRNEEVRVTINTTENVPYRITETVNQTPTDTRTGKTLPLNAFFQFSPS